MAYREISPPDFETLRESTQDRPLDPAGVEAARLRTHIDRLTSDNLHRMAHRGFEARVRLFELLSHPVA